MRRIVAVAATTVLAASLVACGAAEDAANQAKDKAPEAAASAASDAADKAKDAASDAADKAKSKASDMAGGMFEDIKSKLSPEQQKKLESLESVALGDKGELKEDPDALLVAEYFAARQAAVESGDTADVEAIAAKQGLRNAKRYIAKGKAPKTFSVNVVTSESGAVEACVGPKGKNARALTIVDGKVVKNRKGTHTC